MSLNIKRAIKEHGLEAREVARRMNISPVGLSQHINGNPSVEVLERIASAIGCDISELFDKPEGDITALVQYGKDFYSASTIEELEGVLEALKAKNNPSL